MFVFGFGFRFAKDEKTSAVVEDQSAEQSSLLTFLAFPVSNPIRPAALPAARPPAFRPALPTLTNPPLIH